MTDRTLTRETPAADALDLDPEQICALPDHLLAERLAWIRDEILPHATRTLRHAWGLDIALEQAPGLAARLDHLVALERECCGGISFRRVGPDAGGGMHLEIRGADPDARIFRPLLADHGSKAPTAFRVAKAAGFGVLVSLLVCCVLPLAAGALVGSVAAPLAGLDHPVPIAGGAVVGGLAAWVWTRRRETPTDEGPSSGSTGCGPGC